jgi:serine/threonine protein phosphatase 1
MKRTLAIGDIHGGLKGLQQAMVRANVTEKDTLIFLGDYVDGWSDAAQVIEFLMNLSYQQDCHFIYGNHDAYCFDWLTKGMMNSVWLNHGGRETIESYQPFIKDEEHIQMHIGFFKKMENYLIDDQNRLFIHAGYTSMHGPEKEHYASNYGWDRTLWETAMAAHNHCTPSDENYPKRLSLFKEIFIGHTPTTGWGIDHPWKQSNVWNVDTGAGFKGKLSILDIDSGEFWQSDPLNELYPNEIGRNKNR